MSAPLDLTGKVYGRLKVLHLVGGVRRKWVCVCECGVRKSVSQYDLTGGDSTSCGCRKKEQTVRRNKQGKVDVEALTAGQRTVYTKWRSMHGRTRHPHGKSSCYKHVSVCRRWASFYAFLTDMGEPPAGFSLDRINHARGYSPSNCRWVPLAAQAQNTSRNRYVILNGVRACVSEHARRAGLSPDVVFDRINKLGWDVKTALATPKLR